MNQYNGIKPNKKHQKKEVKEMGTSCYATTGNNSPLESVEITIKDAEKGNSDRKKPTHQDK